MRQVIIGVVLSVVLAGCGAAERLIDAVLPTSTPVISQAEITMTICNLPEKYAKVTDAGHTLILDGDGEDFNGGLKIEELACALNYMEVPSFVINIMDNTRAIDGIQREEYGNFKISWSYHPDNGLDVVITEK